MSSDRGTCGECMRFGNDPDLLGDVRKMNLLGCIAKGMEDENDPVATAWCPNAECDHPEWMINTHLVAEDTPACRHKVECCPEDVGGIVACWLVENGFDGLVNEDEECGCDVEDIMPCGSRCAMVTDCKPAYAYRCERCLDAKACMVRHDVFADEPYTTYSADPELCHPAYMPPFERGGDGR